MGTEIIITDTWLKAQDFFLIEGYLLKLWRTLKDISDGNVWNYVVLLQRATWLC
jgi:hypothetical protein